MITIRGWGIPRELKCYRCGLTVPSRRKHAAGDRGDVCQNCGASNSRPYEQPPRRYVTVTVVLAFIGVLLVSMLVRAWTQP